MMRFLEKYYQKVVVGLFCVGIIVWVGIIKDTDTNTNII